MQRREFMFDAAADPGQVFATLSNRYDLLADPPTRARWTCLDTADWRLYGANMTLRDVRRARSASLLLSSADGTRVSAPSRVNAWPRRLDALPPSPVRDRIAPTVGIRALLPLAEVDVRSLILHVRDREQKSRVRVRVEQQRLVGDNSPRPLPLRVLVSPLRGYEQDGDRCAVLLSESMKPLPGAATAATVALIAAGHAPGQPLVAPLRLDPADPVEMSLAAVLRRWLDIIETVRPGVLADVDVEYLHDMRTAVRATRSMLKLSGHLLPGPFAEQFAAEFAWLGRLSASVRDLDVSLLELEGKGDVDLAGLADVEVLRKYLLARRRAAVRSLRAGLQSPRAVGLSSDWRRVLDSVTSLDTRASSTTDAAAVQARSAYRRIVKAATPVRSDTPPEELHRLRHRCKQMRYLLDGYASLYAPGPRGEVFASLKRLQDCLGDIQDVDVQRRQLTDMATTLTRRGASTESILAIGALRDRLRRRDTAARARLAGQLERFCGSKTRALVGSLVPSSR